MLRLGAGGRPGYGRLCGAVVIVDRRDGDRRVHRGGWQRSGRDE